MDDQTLADAILQADENTFSLGFRVVVPRPDTLSDLLDHVNAIHSALVDAGAVSISFPVVTDDADPYGTIMF